MTRKECFDLLNLINELENSITNYGKYFSISLLQNKETLIRELSEFSKQSKEVYTKYNGWESKAREILLKYVGKNEDGTPLETDGKYYEVLAENMEEYKREMSELTELEEYKKDYADFVEIDQMLNEEVDFGIIKVGFKKMPDEFSIAQLKVLKIMRKETDEEMLQILEEEE